MKAGETRNSLNACYQDCFQMASILKMAVISHIDACVFEKMFYRSFYI